MENQALNIEVPNEIKIFNEYRNKVLEFINSYISEEDDEIDDKLFNLLFGKTEEEANVQISKDKEILLMIETGQMDVMKKVREKLKIAVFAYNEEGINSSVFDSTLLQLLKDFDKLRNNDFVKDWIKKYADENESSDSGEEFEDDSNDDFATFLGLCYSLYDEQFYNSLI